MCGRFTLTTSLNDLVAALEHFGAFCAREEAVLRDKSQSSTGQNANIISENVPGVQAQLDWSPRFNIAPTQLNPVLTRKNGPWDLSLMRWGFLPTWAKDEKMGARMINARTEEIARSFKPALKATRCLVLADGWYEWKQKQPYHFQLSDRPLFAFAGLWSQWNDMQTFTILTAQSMGVAAEYHNRMPVILRPETYAAWADPSIDGNDLLATIVHERQSEFEVQAANPCVGNIRNDSAECLRPISQNRLFDMDESRDN